MEKCLILNCFNVINGIEIEHWSSDVSRVYWDSENSIWLHSTRPTYNDNGSYLQFRLNNASGWADGLVVRAIRVTFGITGSSVLYVRDNYGVNPSQMYNGQNRVVFDLERIKLNPEEYELIHPGTIGCGLPIELFTVWGFDWYIPDHSDISTYVDSITNIELGFA